MNNYFKIIKCHHLSGVRLGLVLFLFSILAPSCVKSPVTPEGTASLTVFNATLGSRSLVTNFGNTPLHYYSNAYMAYYGSFTVQNKLNSYSGATNLSLYNYPDTMGAPLFNLALNLPVGSIHSLLLTGTIAHPDTVFTTDKLPYYSEKDSIAGIRFINLSPQSKPVSVNMQGSPNGSLIASLPYKSITLFKPFTAKSATGDYTFEFRDAASGILISQFTASNVGGPGPVFAPNNNWIFKNNSLVVVGSADSVGIYQQQIVLINNF